MNLRQLKELVNSFGEEYNDVKITRGKSGYLDLKEQEVDVTLEVSVQYYERFTGKSSDYHISIDLMVPGCGSSNGVFSDVFKISEEIKNQRKIGAIKEIRYQTHWSLRKAKFYIDRYIPTDIDQSFSFEKAAAKFVADHTEEFLNDEDMEI